jgi:hypothetical protein
MGGAVNLGNRSILSVSGRSAFGDSMMTRLNIPDGYALL